MPTINEMLEKIDQICPNSYAPEVKAKWIIDINTKLYQETVSHYQSDEEYIFPSKYPADGKVPLLAETPYEELYVMYVIAQMDFYNREGANFNNSAAMFNSILSDWKKWFHKTHVYTSKGIREYM